MSEKVALILAMVVLLAIVVGLGWFFFNMWLITFRG
jgi:hypothetical protein